MKLGISSCLLGNKVRYDGQHKLDRFLRDELGPYVEWVPVCPEVECGLGIPRESMRLVGEDPEHPRLITVRTKQDLTDRMESFVANSLAELSKENLRGFVFKSKSPTSGMRGVKIYTRQGTPSKSGSGIFAREFMNCFPDLPVEDEGRLHDAGIRENFIEMIFTYDRWSVFRERDGSIPGLIDFHARHKYLLMSHSPLLLKEAGKIVASAKQPSIETVLQSYEHTIMKNLQLQATVNKHVNVLQHIMGYFKKILSPDEKQELMEVITKYHQHLVPLVVPLVLLQHYVRKYEEPYLSRQWYLNPHPDELKLRNHV